MTELNEKGGMSKHQKRQVSRIIEAALNIVQRDGFGVLNMSSIAEEASMTRQTIYNYFPDVESIIALAVDQHIQAMEEHLLAVIQAADGFENKLLGVADFLFAAASADHQQISLEMGLSAEQRQHIARQNSVIKSHLVASYKEACPVAGAQGADNARAFVDVLWGMIEGAAEASGSHPGDKDVLLGLVNQVLKYALINFPQSR